MAARNGTMLILRGNADNGGTSYPNEKGDFQKWPTGALHEGAATAYARRRDYDPTVIQAAGSTESQKSKTIEACLDSSQNVHALYGFSGGGYNVHWVLEALKKKKTLDRIQLVVVLGAPALTKFPRTGKKVYLPAYYGLSSGAWEVVFRCNPPRKLMPQGLSPKLDTHMFGPDVLLSGWPETDSGC
jgi:hypothetical protein